MKTLATIVIFALTAICATEALAKRIAPKEVKPVEHDGVKYTAPHDNGREGKVVAEDEKTKKKLWDVTVYKVKIDANEEEDVQRVFISGLERHGEKLIVANEKGDSYALDIKTKKVEKLRKK
jgi:tricorn protease-like protein